MSDDAAADSHAFYAPERAAQAFCESNACIGTRLPETSAYDQAPEERRVPSRRAARRVGWRAERRGSPRRCNELTELQASAAFEALFDVDCEGARRVTQPPPISGRQRGSGLTGGTSGSVDCDSLYAQSIPLQCPNDDPTTCATDCKEALASLPQCTAEFQAVFGCALSRRASDFESDTDGTAVIKDGVCQAQVDALTSCITGT